MRPPAEQVSPMTRAATLFLFGALLVGPSLAADQGNVDPKLRRLLQEAVTDNHSFDDRFEAEVWLVDMSRRL